jgi:hydrogenase expression/formation protein HypC
MCLAVPVKITKVEGKEANVEIGGVSRRISLWLTPDAKIGDYVLLHTGYAISVLDQEEAAETLKLFEEIAETQKELE